MGLGKIKRGRNIFIILILFLFSNSASSQEKDSIQISLLTYSQEVELYGAFGHSAIRVRNFNSKKDIIFNYGIFSFGDGFYLKFLQGKLDYELGTQSTVRTLRYYANRGNKKIIEQKLLLTQAEQHEILDYLNWNKKPENKTYRYDFFYDNCSTRLVDILKDKFPEKFVEIETEKTNKTFRMLVDEHIIDRPWSDFGVDLILGMPTDKIATYREQMFLPIYLSNNLENGYTFNNSKLFSPPITVVNGTPYKPESTWFTPFILFSILGLIISIFTLINKRKKYPFKIDSILFLILGILGVIFSFMWFGTEHIPTKWNLNIIWANPLYIFFFISVWKNNALAKYIYIYAILASLLIILSWGNFLQSFHIAILPIVLLMLVRSIAAMMQMRRSELS